MSKGSRSEDSLSPAIDSLLDHWWVPVMRGVLAISFGILTAAIPQLTVLVLLMLFAVFALLDGIVSLTSAMGSRDWGWQVLGGLLSIAIGLVTVQRPIGTGLVVVVLIALWAIARGLLDIADVLSLRSGLPSRFLGPPILSGIVSILFGFFVAIWPLLGVTAISIADLIAAFAIVLGLALVAVGRRERSLWQLSLGSRAGQTTRSLRGAHTAERLASAAFVRETARRALAGLGSNPHEDDPQPSPRAAASIARSSPDAT